MKFLFFVALAITSASNAAGQQSSGDWRGALVHLLTQAYLQRGVVVAVRGEALASSSAALTKMRDDERDLKVKSVEWDVLHQSSVIVLAGRESNPVVAFSSETLPPFSSGQPVVTKAKTPVLVKAGEHCRAAMSDGKLRMRLEAKALNSGRMGEIARIRLTGGHARILRAVVTGRGEVEVLP